MGLAKVGIKPNEAIVVENAPLGVRAAVAAQIFTIAVNTGPLPESALLNEGANMLFPPCKPSPTVIASFSKQYVDVEFQ